MPSFKSLLLIALSLVATTTADSCPQDWNSSKATDGQCCYGTPLSDGPTKFCCVGSKGLFKARNDLPRSVTSSSSSSLCFAQIPFTASDYSQQVSSASSQYVAGATTTPATNEVTPTSSGSAAATTNAAMPIATAQDVVLCGAAFIAGLFVL
ncbi:uncharacterized protein N7443_000068 [Penicillium atrosanguineum]|uniref:uncharacterized protein n=1 Tax=Penicillium atrosanguineum TaxID=1132637 RepID=UPI002394CE14|nr:uncharacterized protein N7443_000068 [Penicillium atrosanguineum]KAJ5148361.1 hypothetical protein N7526_001713 [Penicillium atrosanguineum]KAJ5313184.1 hypothetical protein N7443_000068 [Penicillium atrosanguineum]